MESIKHSLYFQRSNGTYLLLAENVTKEEAIKKMHSFLSECNFKSYYQIYRGTEEQGFEIDVGSWTEFFIWSDLIDQNKIVKT